MVRVVFLERKLNYSTLSLSSSTRTVNRYDQQKIRAGDPLIFSWYQGHTAGRKLCDVLNHFMPTGYPVTENHPGTPAPSHFTLGIL